MTDDTIAAIGTPLGEGGLAVIRISGPSAVNIADRCFAAPGQAKLRPSQAASHTLHYGHILRENQVIDEVMLAVMRAPHTFTREDVVEISCHGGIMAAKLVLDTVLAQGARLAQPGEFTKRAFLNGRIDLTQAEAVIDLIHARTELALAAAQEQLAGKLSQRINHLRDEMLNILAHVEAQIDFPEEDIQPRTRAELLQRLQQGAALMDELLRRATDGQILRRGIRAAIVGRPNAGKSSLLNHLLGHDRAIVSSIAGTTRDTIEETASIHGIPVVFIDTAGLREAGNEIELEGIRRSRETLRRAEIILHVLDVSEPLHPIDDQFLTEFADRRRILVENKVDLPRQLQLPQPARERVVSISCQTSQGLDELRAAIKDMVWRGELGAPMLQAMINSRHQALLDQAKSATLQTITALQANHSLELAAMDLRIAVNTIGEIVGKTATEDLLEAIFSQFCIGK